MKRTLSIIHLLFLSVLLSACSNVTMGFDEDSIFYTKPQSEQAVEIKEKDLETPSVKDEDTENETTFSYDPHSGE